MSPKYRSLILFVLVLPWPLMLVSGFVLPPPWQMDLDVAAAAADGSNSHDEITEILFSSLFGDIFEGGGGIRFPRSCSTHTFKTLWTSACSGGFKRSINMPQGSSVPPPSPPQQQQQQLMPRPVLMNVILVEYYLPQTNFPPQQSGPHHFFQNEPSSNHINGAAAAAGEGSGGWILQPTMKLGSTGGGTEDVAVIIQQNMAFPLHHYPHLVVSSGILDHQHLEGQGTGLILIVESLRQLEGNGGFVVGAPSWEEVFSREIFRRTSGKADEAHRIAKKCCSVGCDEDDFYPLCF